MPLFILHLDINYLLQVINTLEKAISCSQKDAVAFATSIDREGRCIVKCSNFQQCSQTKSTMEKQTSRGGVRPLKVQVSVFFQLFISAKLMKREVKLKGL